MSDELLTSIAQLGDLIASRVAAYTELCEARAQYRMPKDKEYTDFDRKIMLEASITRQTAAYELAQGAEDVCREKIQAIKLLLGVSNANNA